MTAHKTPLVDLVIWAVFLVVLELIVWMMWQPFPPLTLEPQQSSNQEAACAHNILTVIVLTLPVQEFTPFLKYRCFPSTYLMFAFRYL